MFVNQNRSSWRFILRSSFFLFWPLLYSRNLFVLLDYKFFSNMYKALLFVALCVVATYGYSTGPGSCTTPSKLIAILVHQSASERKRDRENFYSTDPDLFFLLLSLSLWLKAVRWVPLPKEEMEDMPSILTAELPVILQAKPIPSLSLVPLPTGYGLLVLYHHHLLRI